MTNTIQLHRILGASPEKIYRAFIDPDALVKWLPPYGFTAKVDKMDPRVGGGYKMSFTNFTTGKSHAFFGKYIELKAGELIKYTDQFEDPNLPEIIQVTINFRKVMFGSEIKITQENLPSIIPVEMCYVGWQQSLMLLAQLIEPEIPD